TSPPAQAIDLSPDAATPETASETNSESQSRDERVPISYIKSKEKPGARPVTTQQSVAVAERNLVRRPISGLKGVGVDLSSRQVLMNVLRNSKLSGEGKKLLMASLRDVLLPNPNRKSVLRKESYERAKAK